MQKLFTLFLVFISGWTVQAQTVQVQFINNSADSIMRSVKVFMNGDLKKTVFLTGKRHHSFLQPAILRTRFSLNLCEMHPSPFLLHRHWRQGRNMLLY
ncbi:MAG: hypothetical protein IPM95_12970 [Sphingobacteriales bacterium]|nr:hypothetical protein [Sphingobacteriales bacterium]